MSYNIFSGAVHTLPQIIEIVSSESPDFLTLNEANTFVDKKIDDFAKLTNFPYFEIVLSSDSPYHVAILSKYPIKKIDKLQPHSRGCIVLVETDLGEISIACLHLSPRSEDERLQEIERVLEHQKSFDKKILMGDLNSLSRDDNYDLQIINDFNEGQIRKFTRNGQLCFEVIDKILSAGYTDIAVSMDKQKESTVPTQGNTDEVHSIPLRLDYIFISQSLKNNLKDYLVLKNDLTNKASDHFPIVANLT